jgi:hypothetical protein
MFEVCEKKCDQCLFTANRVVSPTRMKQILKECEKKDTHFACHKGTIAGKDLCCRGFYDSGLTSNMMRISQRMDWVRFVPVPTMKEPTTLRTLKRRAKSAAIAARGTNDS